MTRKEAMRQTEQENTLLSLGFTRQEAESLRRISMTLHRWHELECGDDRWCLVRGHWNYSTGQFDYSDDGDPYFEMANGSGRNRYVLTADRETGAKRRLAAIMGRVNAERTLESGILRAYIQTDPRGAALYILRPGDVPAGEDVSSYYTRGICVY